MTEIFLTIEDSVNLTCGFLPVMKDCCSAGNMFRHIMVYAIASSTISSLKSFRILLYSLKFTITYLAEAVMHNVGSMLSGFCRISNYVDNWDKLRVCTSNGTQV